jgi:hypothetical protein
MAFRIEKRTSYRWTIEHVLSKKGGQAEEVLRIDVEFKALSAKDAEIALNGARTDPAAFFREVVVGWHEAPEGWEFSPEKFDELINLYPGITAAFIRGYMDSIFGVTSANRKN